VTEIKKSRLGLAVLTMIRESCAYHVKHHGKHGISDLDIAHTLEAHLHIMNKVRARSLEAMALSRYTPTPTRSATVQSVISVATSSELRMLSRSSNVLGNSMTVAVIVGVLVLAVFTLILPCWFYVWLCRAETDNVPATLPSSPGIWNQNFSPIESSMEVHQPTLYGYDRESRHELGI
jgi:hypothetical protein